LAECLLPKQNVVGSNPITRSKNRSQAEAWDLSFVCRSYRRSGGLLTLRPTGLRGPVRALACYLLLSQSKTLSAKVS
jgi:hypothetical protein